MPGDLLGSGTVSGPRADQLGCLLELTRDASRPLELPGGEQRTYLEDGDDIIFRAHCRRDGFVAIGFGECVGRVVPALTALT
jgi:fumarylacetoacetase